MNALPIDRNVKSSPTRFMDFSRTTSARPSASMSMKGAWKSCSGSATRAGSAPHSARTLTTWRADRGQPRISTSSPTTLLSAGSFSGLASTRCFEYSEISITAEGAIHADGEEIGRLELARFDPKQLKREGATLLAARGKPMDGPPPAVMQGALEGSNVNVVRGVVDLVKVSRTYESLLRVIEGYSEINNRAARDIGRAK